MDNTGRGETFSMEGPTPDARKSWGGERGGSGQQMEGGGPKGY